MPISGLVITLAADPHDRTAALEALGGHPAVSLGSPQDQRLPIVVDTSDEQQDRQIWEWLNTLPGVALVTVACIHFENRMDCRGALPATLEKESGA